MNIAKDNKLRIVLDTNIIISALNFGGKPADVMFLAKSKAFDLYLSPFICSEVEGVLMEKFGWQTVKVKEVINFLSEIAVIVNPRDRIEIVKDQADNRILECAYTAAADYLISGDKDLLDLKHYQGTKIIQVNDFLIQLRSH